MGCVLTGKKTGALSDRYLSVHVTNYEEPEVDSELQEGLVVQYDESTQQEQPISTLNISHP